MAKPNSKNKQISRIAKLELIGTQAKPGPELASLGIDMGPFIKEFNDATKERAGDVVPTIITAFSDRSFTFVLKTTPAGILIKKAAGLKTASQKPRRDIVGKVTLKQLEEIAKYKLEDLNTDDLDAAISMLKGQASNMGIETEGETVELKTDGPLMSDPDVSLVPEEVTGAEEEEVTSEVKD